MHGFLIFVPPYRSPCLDPDVAWRVSHRGCGTPLGAFHTGVWEFFRLAVIWCTLCSPSVKGLKQQHTQPHTTTHNDEHTTTHNDTERHTTTHNKTQQLSSTHNNNNTIWRGSVLTGEEPPPHSWDLNHALPQAGGPTQSQLSRPVSSGHHISMEHRLRRKQFNSDTNASIKTYLKEIQEKEKKELFSSERGCVMWAFQLFPCLITQGGVVIKFMRCQLLLRTRLGWGNSLGLCRPVSPGLHAFLN